MVASTCVVAVVVVEVGHDDGDGQRDGQHAGQHAHAAQQLAQYAQRHEVPVAHRRHGNDGPPEGVGDGGELRVRLVQLRVEDGAGEDDGGDAEEEDEHGELAHGGLERHAQDLQPLRVLGQLQDPHHAQHAQHAQHGTLVAAVAVSAGEVEDEEDEVGRDGHQVDPVDGGAEEGELGRADDQTQPQLHDEPGDAARLTQEQRFQQVGGLLRHILALAVQHRHVHAPDVLEHGQRLGAEGDHGQQDEEDGEYGEHFGHHGRLRVLQGCPDLVEDGVPGTFRLLLLHDVTFVLLERVDGGAP